MELTKLDQIRAAEARLLLSTYDRSPVLFTGGEGVYIVDENGTKYLDLLSGIGVNALGYNHPVIVNAIAEQSKKLIHTSNLYYHEGQAELALRLDRAHGYGSRILCEHRHRSMGGRAEAGARSCGRPAQ
jgi:acetylornithine/N-succinyldiaminopimelate aminotransferase